MNTPIKITKGTHVVGDVEVTTAVVVPVPEHDKLRIVSNESHTCGGFYDWLTTDKGYILCELDRYDRYQPVGRRIQSLLAEYFDIDETKLEAEKVAMLDAIRR